MKKITVRTSDRFLFQKIRLALLEKAEVTLNDTDAALEIVDIDSGFTPSEGGVTVSRISHADLRIPFTVKELLKVALGSGPILSLKGEERCAVLRGEPIKLTEVEYALFRALYNRDGEYASREEILSEVWDENADTGVINVYIHYLREKLERGGEKIINSSRKMGYRIDKKYLGGDEC